MPGAIEGMGAATAAAPQATKSDGLGKDDFLKLLVGQLRNQNPMNPLGDQDFIAQMAAFSTLEQVTNLNATGQRLEAAGAISQSLDLVGRTVSYLRDDDTTAEGVVERVAFGEDGAVTITVAGQEGIAPAQVVEVR
jgi:flagellar basal-body rod modification protein FlgD